MMISGVLYALLAGLMWGLTFRRAFAGTRVSGDAAVDGDAIWRWG